MAETRDQAYKAFDLCVEQFGVKYPRAMECLNKDRDQILAFYDFPAEHWTHIRTTNSIESAFSTIRLRTNKTKSCGSRKTTLAMTFKLAVTAEKNWRRLRGFKKLADVIQAIVFKDGEPVIQGLKQRVA